jgi:hypothetical protein
MQASRSTAFHFEGTQLTRVEIDQRSRATRRHLEQVKELLMPRIRPSQSLITQALCRLSVGIRPPALMETVYADSEWE